MKIAKADWSQNPNVATAWVEGGYQRFALKGRSDIISAKIDGDYLDLFPERSSQHKVLLVALESAE